MNIDWTISFSAIVQLLMIGVGAIAFAFNVRGSINLLSNELKHVKETLAPLVPILTMVARQEERLDNHASRMARIEARLDDK